MSNSIQYFEKNGIPNLEKITESFMRFPLEFAEFVKGVRDEFMEIALKYAGDTLTSINNAFRNSTRRAREWEVVDTRLASKITSLGTVKYEKTLFKSKTTGEYAYLVDSFLGFESHERLTEDALEEMLKEAVQTSYRRGGEAASIMDRVSKQTVKNHLHALEFPSENESEKHEKKRVVKKLFIEADEDHIHLQFKKRKGDLRANKLEKKLNGAIVKLVYVHEGIERVAPKSKRHRMINIHYFAGTYEDEKNKELWDEVYAYILNNYDIDKIEKIYLNSDGGAWIKAGRKRLHGITHVLDEFHLRKKVLEMTRHVDGIGKEDRVAMHALLDTIKRDTKEEFISYVDMLLFHASGNDTVWNRVRRGAEYILENWMAAKVRLSQRNKVCGSSTEGHVSHVLSRRMSTLPMGWSKHGADRMAHLRAYALNGGDMLELVRYQKTLDKLPKAAGAENITLSAAKIMSSEHVDLPEWAGYYEKIQVSVSESIRKKAYMATFSVI